MGVKPACAGIVDIQRQCLQKLIFQGAKGSNLVGHFVESTIGEAESEVPEVDLGKDR